MLGKLKKYIIQRRHKYINKTKESKKIDLRTPEWAQLSISPPVIEKREYFLKY